VPVANLPKARTNKESITCVVDENTFFRLCAYMPGNQKVDSSGILTTLHLFKINWLILFSY
jgi:hypothetical protein